MRNIGPSALCVAITLAAAVVACGDSTGPDEALNVAGAWQGTARLPNAYTTTMNLQQTGSGVTGSMTVVGSIVGRTVTGQVDATDRTFMWAVSRNCEIWGGVLSIDAAGQAMSGPVLIDRTGCQPAQSNGSGTLSMTRQ